MADYGLTKTTPDTDGLDLTVQVVKDRGTGRTAIGLSDDATDAFATFLDAVDARAKTLVYGFGFAQQDALNIAAVLDSLRKQLAGR